MWVTIGVSAGLVALVLASLFISPDVDWRRGIRFVQVLRCRRIDTVALACHGTTRFRTRTKLGGHVRLWWYSHSARAHLDPPTAVVQRACSLVKPPSRQADAAGRDVRH